jgi:pimeloyl-ACP methyl ester carboxylesterase
LRLSLAAAVAVLLLFVATAPSAQAAGCSDGFTCSTLSVPLDRSGAVPGTIELHYAVQTASQGAGKTPLILLNGGPGAEGLSYGFSRAREFGPALERYELVALDTRGTGESGAIDCPRAQKTNDYSPVAELMAAAAACGRQLGDRAGLYGTAATVEDIDALRQALGAERISLYGVSYGTHVVQRYVLAHPDRVDRVVLDSPSDPGARDALILPTFAGARRILDGLAPDARRNTAALVRRGIASSSDLYKLLLAGDYTAFLRSRYPTAVRAAVHGRPHALRWLLGIVSRIPDYTVKQLSSGLYFATVCTDIVYPWAQSSDPATRPPLFDASLAALTPAQFAPYEASTVRDLSYSAPCQTWPAIAAGPDRFAGAFPPVPALILVGLADMRTPLESAKALQRVWPGAGLLTAPGAGHEVIGTSDCATSAVNAFLLGRAAADTSCPADSRLDEALSRFPTKVSQIPPVDGKGRAAHAFGAALATFRDAQGALLTMSRAPGHAHGFRGGTMSWTLPDDVLTVRLHNYRYLPGVRMSGHVHYGDSPGARLVVRGAIHGTIALTKDGWVGRFGGRRLVEHR